MDRRTTGIYHKFNVQRTDGSDKPGGKHHGCRYFVLDLDHDKFAKPAMAAYANACEGEYPALAADCRKEAGGAAQPPAVDRERRLREALASYKCRCSKAIDSSCPNCGEKLFPVRNNGCLNDDQFDAIKAGDWYCETCPDASIRNGKKHWHDRELKTVIYQTCDRCAALADPPPPDPREAALEKAELFDWLLQHGFKHADASLGRSEGEDWVDFTLRFQIPEPKGWPLYQEDEWTEEQVLAAIRAARGKA